MRIRKNRLLATCSIILAVTFAYTACRKSSSGNDIKMSDTPAVYAFFNTHISSDPTVNAISNRIYRQNQKKNFIDKFVTYAGYPIWDKAKIYKRPTENRQQQNFTGYDKLVYIPFSPKSYETIGAILIAGIKETDTVFQMLYHWQYAEYGFEDNSNDWNARDIFNLFADFEYSVFGNKEFMIKDNKIFGLSDDPDSIYYVTMLPRERRSGIVIETEYCVDYKVCKVRPVSSTILAARLSSLTPDCYEFSVCTYYYEFYDKDPSDGGGGGPAPDPGGGGGGPVDPNDWGWTDDPCKDDVTGPVGSHASTFCGGASKGWLPLEPFVKINDYDLSDLPSDPSDPNNCLLHHLLYDFPKEKAQKLLTKMFLASQYTAGASTNKYKFSFHLDANLTNQNGNPVPGHTDITELSPGNWQAIITLNPSFWTPHTSKEFVNSVILHEILHVFLKSFINVADADHHKHMFEQRSAGLIFDALKEMYPPTSNNDLTNLMALSLYGLPDQFEDPAHPGVIDPVRNQMAVNNFQINIADVLNIGQEYRNHTRGDLFCQ